MEGVFMKRALLLGALLFGSEAFAGEFLVKYKKHQRFEYADFNDSIECVHDADDGPQRNCKPC